MSILPTPPTEGIGISWGVGGSARPAMYEDQSEFPEGWGGGGDLKKFPSVGELWIFSGTTQFSLILG